MWNSQRANSVTLLHLGLCAQVCRNWRVAVVGLRTHPADTFWWPGIRERKTLTSRICLMKWTNCGRTGFAWIQHPRCTTQTQTWTSVCDQQCRMSWGVFGAFCTTSQLCMRVSTSLPDSILGWHVPCCHWSAYCKHTSETITCVCI